MWMYLHPFSNIQLHKNVCEPFGLLIKICSELHRSVDKHSRLKVTKTGDITHFQTVFGSFKSENMKTSGGYP